MKMMVIGETAVITVSNDAGKLPGELKGKVFRYGIVIGPCRNLPVLLSHFEEKVTLIEGVNSPDQFFLKKFLLFSEKPSFLMQITVI